MTKKTEAKCNGSMLTVGFHSANPPLIWRFDLERNHSFTLALQGEDGDWELGITSPKGDFYPVVHFAAREDAEEAFAKVEKALSVKRATKGVVTRFLLVLLAVVLAILGGFALFGLYVTHGISHGSSAITSSVPPTVVGAPPSAGLEEGIPLPADDVLKPPR